MGFMDLPNEILGIIVSFSLPGGFENLALSCKRIHALYTPYLEHHNDLCWHFRDFRYGKTKQTVTAKSQMNRINFPNLVNSSFNLIARIASEPIVAEYIETANFSWDYGGEDFSVPPYFREPVVKDLFARSSYLKEAGLDWEQYYAAIMENHAARHSSQYAAVFVLTLLPNIRNLTLPTLWDPYFVMGAAPGKLLEVIAHRARTADQVYHRPSLARVTEVRGDLILSPGLEAVFPFLFLPSIQCLQYPYCGDTGGLGGHNINFTTFTSGVEEIDLGGALLYVVDMANLLKLTPRLKKLKYWVSSETSDLTNASEIADWNPGWYITVIADQVGRTLETLSINIGNIPPGEFSDSSALSMGGFKQLKTLEISLQSAVCSLMAPGPERPRQWLLTDLVPASVSQLSLVAQGTEVEASALKTLFHDFAASIHPQLPRLREIHLTSPPERGSELYAEQYKHLAVEAEKAGVVFQGTKYVAPTNWDDEEEINEDGDEI